MTRQGQPPFIELGESDQKLPLPDRLNLRIDRDKLAPPGVAGELWLVFAATNPGSPTPAAASDGEERDFLVSCLLARDTSFSRTVNGLLDPEEGSSFFVLPPGPERMALHVGDLKFTFQLNSRRELALIESQVRASGNRAARQKFMVGIVPALDHLAFMANTPLIVARTICEDIKHHTMVVNYDSPYRDVIINPGMMSVRGEMMPIYGLYREAKNATSSFYRFLCYFKILEGIFDHLRPAVFKSAKDRGQTLVTAKEIMPEHPELRLFNPDVIGMPIKQLVDGHLRARFRDAVAHYLLDSGAPLNPGDPATVAQFAQAVLPTELACGVVIRQQLNYYEQLDGSKPIASGS